MKSIRFLAGLLTVLLSLFLLTACRKEKPHDLPATEPSDTTASDATVTDSLGTETTDPTPSDSQAEEPTSADTELKGEPETAAPSTLSAEELKALLNAALDKETGDAAVTVRTAANGEVFSTETYIRLGKNFYAELQAEDGTRRITVVGDKAYYYTSVPNGARAAEGRFVMAVTAEERGALLERFFGADSMAGVQDAELAEALLNGSVKGVRHADGTVELTCTGLDDSLAEGLFGASMEGADLTFDFMLDRSVRMTYMRCTVSLAAEVASDEAVTVSSETSVNYAPAAIAPPKDAVSYTSATYDDVFGTPLPEADPDDALSAGVPLDKDHYTFIGENPTHGPEEQYMFILTYPHYYAGKTFTLYGNMTENAEGRPVLWLGNNMEFVVGFNGVSAPAVGTYVRITAVYTKTDAKGDDGNFNSYTMMATSCEVLGEAKGPNGGRLMYVTSSALNVRASSDTTSASNILGTLSMGDLVEVFEQDAKGWYRIIYKGQTGYVSSKYLSETKP